MKSDTPMWLGVKQAFVNFRCTKREHADLKACAKAEGLGLGDYILVLHHRAQGRFLAPQNPSPIEEFHATHEAASRAAAQGIAKRTGLEGDAASKLEKTFGSQLVARVNGMVANELFPTEIRSVLTRIAAREVNEQAEARPVKTSPKRKAGAPKAAPKKNASRKMR